MKRSEKVASRLRAAANGHITLYSAQSSGRHADSFRRPVPRHSDIVVSPFAAQSARLKKTEKSLNL